MENETISILPQPAKGPGGWKLVFIIILSFLLFVAIAIAALNSFSSWRCADGEWIRNGFPLSGKPIGRCESGDINFSKADSEKKEISGKASEILPANEMLPDEVYKNDEDGLVVFSPKPGDIVKTPLVVSGRVKTSWLFEGSFSAKLMDSQGNVFSSASAEADNDWPDKEWVGFSSTIKFARPDDAEGYLILEPDDISGHLNGAASVTIPVKFNFDSAETGANPDWVYSQCGHDPKDDPILGDCGEDCNTDNWNVYKNKKYGYSFRYPQGFVLTKDCKSGNCVTEEQGGDSVRLSGDLSESGWPMIAIRHLQNEHYNPPAGTAFGEWVMEKFSWTKECIPQEANIYFSDKLGKLHAGFNIFFPRSPQAYSRREIYYYREGKIFQIIMLDAEEPQARQFYDIWLSTFQVAGED